MRVSIVAAVVTLTLMVPMGAALAQTSVTIPPPVVTPPIVVPPPGFGLGKPNPFPNTVPPGSTPPFQTGIANPFNNPHPMLPWGDGQIGGERWGQVIRYWQQHPQVVENVIFLFVADVPEEEAKPQEPPESKPEGQPQDQQQGPPAAPPATIRATGQGAVEARAARAPQPQSVTVPGSWIVETTRGYIYMPRWVLQEVGGGRYQWAWVGTWFQPR